MKFRRNLKKFLKNNNYKYFRRYSTASRDPGYQVYGGVGYRPEYGVLDHGTTGYGNLDQENLGYGNLDQGYGNLDHGYGHQDTRDYIVDPSLNKSNQRLVNSDLSSSTLGNLSIYLTNYLSIYLTNYISI